MSRKPRLLLHDNVIHVQPDDVVVDIARWQFTSPYRQDADGTMIDRSFTDRIEDPLDWFSELVAAHRVHCSITIYLDPYRDYTRKLFPWINPGWYSLGVSYLENTIQYEIEYYVGCGACFITDNPPAPGELEHIEKDYAKFQVPETRVFFSAPDAELERFTNHVFGRGIGGSHENWFGSGKTIVEYADPHNVVRQALDALVLWQNVQMVVAPIDRDYTLSQEAGETLLSNDDYKLASVLVQPVWTDSGLCRWPYVYYTILDAAIPLLAEIGLQPYVVLEIVDWLPRIDLWSHRKKIELLVRVRDSISKVREARELAAQAKRTDSRRLLDT